MNHLLRLLFCGVKSCPTISFLVVLTALACHADPPCDLDKVKEEYGGSLPEIYLSGEEHLSFYCNVDKAHHLKKALSGELILAREGSMFYQNNPSELRIKGFDDPLMDAIGELHHADFSVRNKDANPDRVQSGFIRFVNALNLRVFLHESWLKLRKYQKEKGTSAGQEEKDLAALIDAFLEGAQAKINLLSKFNSTRAMGQIQAKAQSQAAKDLVKRFAYAFIEDYNDIYQPHYQPGSSDLPQHLPRPIASVALEKIDKTRFFDDLAYADQFFVDKRNEFMADNLVQLYCEAAQLGKPLFVFVGIAHISGLKPILNQRLGGKVTLIDRDSKQVCESLFQSTSPEEAREILTTQYLGCMKERSEEAVQDTIHSLELSALCLRLVKSHLRDTPKEVFPKILPAAKEKNCSLKCNLVKDLVCEAWCQFGN
jgi:hypothetical protein